MPESIIDQAWGFAWKLKRDNRWAFHLFGGAVIGLPMGLIRGENLVLAPFSGFMLGQILFSIADLGAVLWRIRREGLIVEDFGRERLAIVLLAVGLFAPFSLCVFSDPKVAVTLFAPFPGTISVVLYVLFWVSVSVECLLDWLFARLQLRENGIRLNGVFLQWDEIESYAWEGEDGLDLAVEVENKLSLYILAPSHFRVPSDKKGVLDQWFRQYCPAATNAS